MRFPAKITSSCHTCMLIELFHTGMPVVRRSVGRSGKRTITRLSLFLGCKYRMHRLPNFLTHGARLASARAPLTTHHKKTQSKEKVQKNAQFSFSGQRKAFLYQIAFEEFEIHQIFTTAERSALPVLKPNQAAKFLKNFQAHFVLYSQENCVFKWKFMYF